METSALIALCKLVCANIAAGKTVNSSKEGSLDSNHNDINNTASIEIRAARKIFISSQPNQVLGQASRPKMVNSKICYYLRTDMHAFDFIIVK